MAVRSPKAQLGAIARPRPWYSGSCDGPARSSIVISLVNGERAGFVLPPMIAGSSLPSDKRWISRPDCQNDPTSATSGRLRRLSRAQAVDHKPLAFATRPRPASAIASGISIILISSLLFGAVRAAAHRSDYPL